MVLEGVNWWRMAEDRDKLNFVLHQMRGLYVMSNE